ncbi:MAG: AspC3 [Candidatus Roizmanbacteria bacterium GW2011_GWA2_33_33]|uniref:AspC3 n=2 Tax=Candidatus Roizmaniibacteriota TaxID=1752723 RepID=A0A0G0BCN1_9BACT|nr:MAG: AspC3 [Candidatus Roizmanbacteria bacterium GW2011_GWA2_33_33]KKP61371.1 MAG: AspC3 [Candidatus Roizmanbacteria bacterium GW2011_GWC2_34_23]
MTIQNETFNYKPLPNEKEGFQVMGGSLEILRRETQIWGISKLMKLGADIPQNIMRAEQITKAIETGRQRFDILHNADIGMPMDKDLEIQPIIDQANLDAANFINEHSKYQRYTNSQGLPELRNSVANFYQKFWGLNINQSWVVASNGASEMWQRFVASQLAPGDLVMTLDPHYNPFDVDLAMKGAGWVPIKTKAENGFHFNEDDLSRAFKEKKENQPLGRIKAVYINSPANPTGVVYTEKEINILVDFALRNNLFIVMDGVYSLYNYSNNPTLMDYLKNLLEDKRKLVYNKLVFLDSMSKLATTTGERIGINFVPNDNLRDQLGRALSVRGNPQNHGQLQSSYILDRLTEDYTQNRSPEKKSILEERRKLYFHKMHLFYEQFYKNAGAHVLNKSREPEGGLYIPLLLDGNKVNALDFFDFSMNQFIGHNISDKKHATSFVPMAVTFPDGSSASFRVGDFEQAQKEIRVCIGLDVSEINDAAEALANQLIEYNLSLSKD